MAINVLLIEDENRTSGELQNFFAERPEIELHAASDGPAVLNLLRRGNMDVLLLEHHLPENQAALNRVLERLFRFPRPESPREALRMGYARFFPKNDQNEMSGALADIQDALTRTSGENGARKSHLAGLDAEYLSESLLSLMEEESLYRDEDLSLPGLSEKLGVTAHQLSELLNRQHNQNFKSFVNSFRLREARELLIREPERTVLSIALEVGFGSKSTFNRAFAREEGRSPEAFRREHRS